MEPNFEIKEEFRKDNFAKFVVTPLHAGYGNTLGTALKRVLLTSIPGTAITTVKIAGVKHQFSTLIGMKEDILDFLLNLKKVRLSYDGTETLKLSLSVTGPGEVKAGDIKVSPPAKITNPDLVIGNLNKGAKIEAEMTAERGVGYSEADERPTGTIGLIAVDAIYSPILRVDYKVEETRVGRVTNYDKLSFEITTDGTIEPSHAIREAAKIVVSYFSLIVSPKEGQKEEKAQISDNSLGMIGKLSVEEIGLPTRVANALSKAGFDTVEKLVNAPKEELIKVRNLGEKSIDVIKKALSEKGVELSDA